MLSHSLSIILIEGKVIKMKKRNIVLVTLLTLGIVFGSVAYVNAGTGSNKSGNVAAAAFSKMKDAFGKGLKLGPETDMDAQIATFLGITEDELRTELQSGKTLAAIATNHGKTEDALIQFIVEKEKANLDTALKNGTITQTQYDNMVANLEARVKERVERTQPMKGEKGFRFGITNSDIATFLGITEDELRTELQSGKTLAAIATNHGKTEDALIQFIVEKEKANLDTALKNGTITQTQYDNMVANLEARVKERVEKTCPFRGQRGHRP